MTEKNKHIEDKTIRHYGEEALREEAEAKIGRAHV